MRGYFMKKIICAALAAAMLLAPASAATCWKKDHVEAAQVRNFEMMLMVSALRCNTSAYDFLPAYNQFVREKRTALVEVNDALRSHFADVAGLEGGLDAYDDYVIMLANSYGAGAGGLECRDLQAIQAAANAVPASRAAIWKLSESAGIAPRIDAPQCDMAIALANDLLADEGVSGGSTGRSIALAEGGARLPSAQVRGPAN
ncbi:hypothetical protein GS397_09160 [Sphingobium yanoikuyae]|uniref:S-adenosyl-L-homocysteine hydrolase n=2 Tax=Sphingobium yanoikuyae TaxID=13690 RepID=A0A6P1GFK6_SPHYA|nr:hypothetical protein GS397_09160 [Sphingobium yanoikuyae]